MSGSPTGREAVDGLLHAHSQMLGALMRSGALMRGDLESGLHEMTGIAAALLGVERVSVWRFDGTRTQLDCLDLYERTPDRHTRGQRLEGSSRPRYFKALRDERSIAAHEACSDQRTSEFAQDYLQPLGIGSMLDAPVLLRGELVGVVCHEHVGTPRHWQLQEELLAATFADFVAMLLAAAERAAEDRELERLVEDRTRKLQQSEESYRQLFATSPVALVLTRLTDHTVIAANARASEMFDVELESAAGRRAPDFWVRAEDRARLLDQIRATGVVERFEAEVKTSKGVAFHADISARALSHGLDPALLVGVRDISVQKLAEQSLRQSRETLQTLFDTAPIPLVLTRWADSVVRYCNERAASMFGTTVLEAVGRHAPDFYEDPRDREGFIERLRAEGRVENFAARLKALSGRAFWALLNAKRLTLEGEELFMVGFQDLSEQKAVEERLWTLATTDQLTGALNRRRFLEVAEDVLGRASRDGRQPCLAMIDADHFKSVNDRYGHAVGDEALRHLSRCIGQRLRRSDILGRYGGEELLVLLPDVELEAARAIMDRVREAISTEPLPIPGGHLHLTVSVGLVKRRPDEALEALLKRVDAALYVAKAEGRNRVISGG